MLAPGSKVPDAQKQAWPAAALPNSAWPCRPGLLACISAEPAACPPAHCRITPALFSLHEACTMKSLLAAAGCSWLTSLNPLRPATWQVHRWQTCPACRTRKPMCRPPCRPASPQPPGRREAGLLLGRRCWTSQPRTRTAPSHRPGVLWCSSSTSAVWPLAPAGRHGAVSKHVSSSCTQVATLVCLLQWPCHPGVCRMQHQVSTDLQLDCCRVHPTLLEVWLVNGAMAWEPGHDSCVACAPHSLEGSWTCNG